jgi:rhodanese-related sulfurtransferase
LSHTARLFDQQTLIASLLDPNWKFLKKALILSVLSLWLSVADAQLAWLFRAPKDFAEVHQVIAQKFPTVPTVGGAELANLMTSAEPPLLLDYRTRAEYEVSHLPGAIWVADLKSARAQIAKVRGSTPQRKVVLYCSVGYRSADLATQLQKLPDKGYAQELYNLKGSLFLWANEGRPFVRTQSDGGEIPAALVHPYSAGWGTLLLPQLRAPLN